ncbi:hypothetical protein Sjap_012991 [Stephania japonica]|uniref:Uncharacterized protein n=1 Tax=Stephania japonica TaxID=461633 RepID=A0AAP0IX69_9MAGN
MWWGGVAVVIGAGDEGGASLGSPTTISREEEEERGVVSTTPPPPLPFLRWLVRGWRPSVQPLGSLQYGYRWREMGESGGVEGSPPLHGPNKGGARAPPLIRSIRQLTGQLVSWTS